MATSIGRGFPVQASDASLAVTAAAVVAAMDSMGR
jgi:hypothetical protein